MIKRLLIIYLLAFSSHMCRAQLVCSFSATDTSGCTPLVVTFTDNSSGTATAWYWNFGNGDTSTQKNSVEAFNDTGTFNILHVVSNGVIYDSASLTIRVNAGANANFFPSSVFSNCPPFPVQFTQLTGDSITYSLWSFGDGDTSQVQDPFHIYIHPGLNSVTHIVHNKYGCFADTTLTNLIQIKGPVANNIIDTPNAGCTPLTVHFSAQLYSVASSIFVPGPGAVYNNGIPGTFNYIHPGVYEPTLTLTDSFGCTVPYSFPPDTVGPLGIQLIDTPNHGCVPLTVHFSAQIINLASGMFTSGTGVSFNALPDSFTYQLQGVDTPAFNITDSGGCTAKYFFSAVYADSCGIAGILPVNAQIICIAPNPAANFVQINASGIFNMNMFNASGQVCLKKEQLTLPANININQFPPGLYIIALYNTKTDQATTYKLVVDR